MNLQRLRSVSEGLALALLAEFELPLAQSISPLAWQLDVYVAVNESLGSVKLDPDVLFRDFER